MLPRTVNQVLEYQKLISDAECNTIILCGSAAAGVLPLKLGNIRAWGSNSPIFWVPYPNVQLSTPLMFGHIIVDPSFNNQSQAHVDWFEREVMPHIAVQCKVTHIA